MTNNRRKTEVPHFVSLVFGMTFLCMTVACGPSTEDMAARDQECSQLASARTGYDPSNPEGSKSAVGKGAAIGAVGGAALGAITSSKSKKVVQGAAIGAAAGAGAGALKNNEDKKKAEQAAANYQVEYQHCMSSKGN
jgi:hypothetical protein